MSKCTALIKIFSFCGIFEPLFWLSALPFFRGSHGRRKTILLLLFCPVWFYGALVTWPCMNSTFWGTRSLFPSFSSPPRNLFFFQSEGWLLAVERVRWWAKNKSHSRTEINSAKFLPTLLSPTQAPTKTPPERGNEEEAVGFFFRAPRQEGEEVWEEQKHGFSFRERSEWEQKRTFGWARASPLLSSLEKCLFLAPSPPSLSPLPSS